MKEKLRVVQNFIVKYYKIAFPILVVAAVAVTVVVALNMGREKPEELQEPETSTVVEEAVLQQAVPDVPLVANENGDVYSLLATYYNAAALGDTNTISQICDVVTETEVLRYQVAAQYIEMYPVLEIYTKVGPEANSFIAYVYYKVTFQNQTAEFPGYQALYLCTDETGNLYIKRGEITEEEKKYIEAVNSQVDVAEFNNRIIAEFNELMLEQPDLLTYLNEFEEQVNKEVGEILAKQSGDGAANSDDGQNPDGNTPEGENSGEGAAQDGEAPTEDTTAPPAENEKQYATATTTVNVRSSDSEQADKLGKVSGGTKLEVLENRVNGWSKVLFEGKEGFIKTEYLQMSESAEGVESTGTVTATTNINVRASASETAEKLGIVAGGDTLELIANEGEWSKIKYNGQVGYVKSEYVQ